MATEIITSIILIWESMLPWIFRSWFYVCLCNTIEISCQIMWLSSLDTPNMTPFNMRAKSCERNFCGYSLTAQNHSKMDLSEMDWNCPNSSKSLPKDLPKAPVGQTPLQPRSGQRIPWRTWHALPLPLHQRRRRSECKQEHGKSETNSPEPLNLGEETPSGRNNQIQGPLTVVVGSNPR